MKSNMSVTKSFILAIVFSGCCFLLAGTVWAHCDTMSGPVIPEAKAALDKGDVTPILKWIKRDNEAEIKAAFEQAVVVRAISPEAKALADQYFLETLIRLHRTGEGAPYTGLKDEPVEPVVAMTDKALADGSVDEMIHAISNHMAAAIKEKFAKAVEAQKHKDESVEAGREFVEAYVTYTHYVEGIHSAILAAGLHHHEGGETDNVTAPSEHNAHKD